MSELDSRRIELSAALDVVDADGQRRARSGSFRRGRFGGDCAPIGFGSATAGFDREDLLTLTIPSSAS